MSPVERESQQILDLVLQSNQFSLIFHKMKWHKHEPPATGRKQLSVPNTISGNSLKRAMHQPVSLSELTG